MPIVIAVAVIATIAFLAGLADRRARRRRQSIGDDRFSDASAGTAAITRSRRSAAINGGYGVPGTTLGSGE